MLFGLPGVGLRSFATGVGENLVKLIQGFFAQRDFRGAQGGVQLLNGSGTDDGRGHDRVVQKPGQGDGRWRFAQLFAKSLVLFQPGLVLLDFLEGLLTGAPAAFQLLQGSAQEATAQGISPKP